MHSLTVARANTVYGYINEIIGDESTPMYRDMNQI